MVTFTDFSGSPYHIGLALGKAGAPAMHALVTPSPLWAGLMQWLGSDELHAMQERVQHHHPYIWDELQGLARGLELPPDKVFLWNSQGTLPARRAPDDAQAACVDDGLASAAGLSADAGSNDTAPETQRPGGYTAVESTTILIPAPQGPRIVHHMAGDPDIANHCGVAEFRLDQGPEFAAFVSPGLLPGHAVAVTNSGLCITVNTTLPQTYGIGIPNIVLTRALLNMPDLSSAIQFLNDSPRCSGLHLGLAQRGGSALLSIETNAERVSVQHVKVPVVHTNHLIHDAMQDVAQTITPSSRFRLDAGNDLLTQTGHTDPLHLLARLASDARHPSPAAERAHPVLASGRHDDDLPDLENEQQGTMPVRTLVTADLHINADAVDWDVYQGIDEPARFRMRDAKHI